MAVVVPNALDCEVEVADGAGRFGPLAGVEPREESHWRIRLRLLPGVARDMVERHSVEESRYCTVPLMDGEKY